MEKMQITFLGTSSAVPTASRNHTAILLTYKAENILIDCGEGTQRQFRKAEINPCKITRLLITHLHGDHIFGIPGLFQTLALNDYQKTLQIYGPKGTKKTIEEITRIFIKNKKIKTNVIEVSGSFLKTPDFEIKSLALDHDSPTNGYEFVEKDKLRISREKLEKLSLKNHPDFKKLIQGKNIKINNKTIKYKDVTYLEKGRKVSFIFDTRLCENAKKLAKNSDVAIIESTFTEDSPNGERLAKEYFHLTAKQAAGLAKQGKAKQLILIHLSQRYEFKEKIVLDEAKKVFPETKIAKDLMKLSF